MKKIGTKVYYCTLTGNVLKIIGDMMGSIKETTFNEDYEIYKELNEREKDTIKVLSFDYGEYQEVSKNSTGCYFDLEQNSLVFTYEEVEEEKIPPTDMEIMNEKINILESENADLLFDSVIKDEKISRLEKDMSDLMFEVMLGGS